jgi:SAM-dependent methyltransferase
VRSCRAARVSGRSGAWSILISVPVDGPPSPSGAARRHWEDVYATRGARRVSWFQPEPKVSLALIAELGTPTDAAIIDVGGGTSRLAGRLLALGFSDLTVLDLSARSLEVARSELGARAAQVRWIEQDLLSWIPQRQYDLWHDRALFHFLVDPAHRDRYRETLAAALRVGGRALIATFAADGPDSCSGLPVARYDADRLAAAFGAAFVTLASHREEHLTPTNVLQPFTWVALERCPPDPVSASHHID